METANKLAAKIALGYTSYRNAMKQNIINYARFDKSDPFAAARAITHTLNGISDPSNHYEATESNGHFVNVKRP